jgi:hypothetical protein
MNLRSTSGKAPPWIGIIAVIAIAAAGYFITQQVRSGPGRATDPTDLVIICPACNEQFPMKAAEYAEKLKESPTRTGIVCPSCGKPGARVASQCVNPECDAYYLRPGADGIGSNVCPECGTPRTQAPR